MTSVAPPRPARVAAGSPASCPASLSLIDAFELRSAGAVLELPMSAQRLLAFVALHERPLSRSYVAGTLWSEASEERAAASLRSSLWRLNRLGHGLVDTTGGGLRLSADLDVDVRRTVALAHGLLNGAPAPLELEAGATGLDGELLPGWYDEWLLFEQERFRQLGLRALEALAGQLIAAGRLGQALDAALSAVRGEPLRESAHRVLIRVHLAEGNGAEALRQYELCRRLLRDRLGLEPSAQLDELVHPLTR